MDAKATAQWEKWLCFMHRSIYFLHSAYIQRNKGIIVNHSLPFGFEKCITTKSQKLQNDVSFTQSQKIEKQNSGLKKSKVQRCVSIKVDYSTQVPCFQNAMLCVRNSNRQQKVTIQHIFTQKNNGKNAFCVNGPCVNGPVNGQWTEKSKYLYKYCEKLSQQVKATQPYLAHPASHPLK